MGDEPMTFRGVPIIWDDPTRPTYCVLPGGAVGLPMVGIKADDEERLLNGSMTKKEL